MTNIALAVLALSCAGLSVGVAGLLRRVTDVKLALGGYSGEIRQFIIDFGRRLPASVVEGIPEPTSDALILVGSTSCDACKALIGELDKMPGQILLAILDQDRRGLSSLTIGRSVVVLDADAAGTLARDFDISQVPVVITQRDGVVVGAAYGSAIESGRKLRDYWEKQIGRHQTEVHAT